MHVIQRKFSGEADLPAMAALAGGLTGSLVVLVLVANAALGVLFGYLFWRYGLEAAILAHAAAHIVSDVLGLL